VIATRARAVYNNALQPVAIHFGEHGTKAREDRVIVEKLIYHIEFIEAQQKMTPQIYA
jgi:hypothetical protein